MRRSLAALLVLAGMLAAGGALDGPLDARARAAAAQAAAAQGEDEHDDHDEHGVIDLIATLVNFAILAGILVYFLRSPLAQHLDSRAAHVRSELVQAAETRAAAAAQIAEIDRRLEALPAEIEALRARDAREVADEEARIRRLAEVERERLLAQVRREIDLQVRVAKRVLLEEAADITVGAAAAHLRREITEAEQARLVDRYLTQVRDAGA